MATEAEVPLHRHRRRADDRAGNARPNISSVNFAAGATRANNAVATLNTAGAIAVFRDSAGTAHFVLDVNGFFR